VLYSIWVDIKLIFRIPVSVFFTLGFPIVLMVIMLISYGNPEIGENLRLVDKYFLITAGMGIAPLTLLSLPMWIGNSIERSYLRRLRYFGVNLGRVALSNLIAHIFIGILGILLNFIVAATFFHLSLPSFEYIIAYFLQVFYCLLSFMVIGSILGLLVKQPAIIMPLGLLLMFVTFMLCGGFLNYNDLPDGMRAVSDFIPLKYAMNDLFETWRGERAWDTNFLLTNTVYLVSSLFILAAIARTTFYVRR